MLASILVLVAHKVAPSTVLVTIRACLAHYQTCNTAVHSAARKFASSVALIVSSSRVVWRHGARFSATAPLQCGP
jgi:hypothetical protein